MTAGASAGGAAAGARPLGFGLIGTGMAGGCNACELEQVEGARLVAVCSRDSERACAFAAEHGAPAGTPTTNDSSPTPKWKWSACSLPPASTPR